MTTRVVILDTWLAKRLLWHKKIVGSNFKVLSFVLICKALSLVTSIITSECEGVEDFYTITLCDTLVCGINLDSVHRVQRPR